MTRKAKPIGISMPTDWEARDDLHTLTRAEEIRRDEKRLTAAQREANRQHEALTRVRRLKNVKI